MKWERAKAERCLVVKGFGFFVFALAFVRLVAFVLGLKKASCASLFRYLSAWVFAEIGLGGGGVVGEGGVGCVRGF